MRTTVIAAVAAALFVTGSVAQAEVTDRKFVSGGTVRLELDAGDYDIVASKDDHIRVIREDRGGRADVTLRLDSEASRATVHVDTPWKSTSGPSMRIELPRRSNIIVRLSAGDLKIEGIEGSKDVSARAGDVNIGVGRPDQYRYVKASVTVGDLTSDAFNFNKDGVFRSFEWTGKGQYELRAHLMAGDLKLDR